MTHSIRPAATWAMAAAVALLPVTAFAHKTFLVPATTVLSNENDAWITVDAAVSNDLFNFNHVPLALDGLAITAPDGTSVTPENASKGKARSTFDVHLTQPGTYRIAVVMDSAFASYENAKGEKKRARGDADSLAKEIPADAKNVEITQSSNRVETFATMGKPNDTALKPSGRGLELVPVTRPNDLVVGEKADFRFLIDGKPAANLKVTAVLGGTRYRDKQDEINLVTDADGKFAATFPAPGLYWVNASLDGLPASIKGAKQRRVGYTATLEVLPQ